MTDPADPFEIDAAPPVAGSHTIDPALEGLTVPLAKLTPHPENYRRGNVAAIAASLVRFGQVRPIVVQASTGNIVAGNHTFAAAASLGWSHIAAAVVELTDEEARAYLVADNRTSDVAENDDEQLAEILAGLAESGKLEGTGFDDADLDALVVSLGALQDAPPPPPPPAPQEPAPTAGEGKSGAGPMDHRQYTIVLATAQADEFDKDIDRLKKHYETTGLSATLVAAVGTAVERANAPRPRASK